MKAIWHGTISFGLVNIPVRMYSAIQEHVMGFTLLCKKCHTPIQYERWCRKCHKQITWEGVVKGLKLDGGDYFIITQEKLHELRPEKTDRIDIKEFIEHDQLKLLYLGHHYYMGPEKIGSKAFFLFKMALEQTGKIGIGQFVMRDKEYVCAITAYEDGLLLSTLNYSYEIRDMSAIGELDGAAQIKIDKKELELAEKLIAQLTSKSFNLDKYKDSFMEELVKEIKKGKREKVLEREMGKGKGKRKKIKEDKKIKKEKKIKEDLGQMLKKSLVVSKREKREPVARARGRR